MKPIVRIGMLIDNHEDWHRKKNNIPLDEPSIPYKNCPGCEICDEIDKLSKKSGLKSKKKEAAPPKPKKIKVDKFNYEEYKELRAQGMKKMEIAKKFDIAPSTLTRKVQNSEREEKRKIREENKPEPPKPVERAKEEDEYLDKIFNGDVSERINKLIQENADLVAESERIKGESLEKEQELLFELDKWKKEAETYQAECRRLTKTLAEERKETERYKGLKIALQVALKAVL